MLIDIDKIVVGDRIRKDFGDIEELAEDIKENTLLNALVVTPSGNGDGTYLLIAGERRLRACKMLGYKAVPVNTVGVDDAEQALMMEISENECRKEFTKTERLEYARRLASIEGAKAKERMLAGKADPTQKIAEGETRQIVAQALGTNRETLRQEQFIADNADIRGLKDDQFVDLIKADNIKKSAQSRVAELLGIKFDERGGVADESRYDYVHYYAKFIGRLHVDARNAGLEGPRIYATPRKNYQPLIDFINEWVPLRGVEGLKSYYDGLADARRKRTAA